jgi:phage terminase small subunit
MAKLTERQKRFCQEYIIDLNGTQAAIRAGYRKHSSEAQACKLLAMPHVKEKITSLMDARSKRTEITADQVIQELAKIGFHNVQDYINEGNTVKDFTKIPREHAASVSSVKVTERKIGTGKTAAKENTTEFKLHDKRAALESLGKHLGIFEKDNRQKNSKVVIKVSAKKSQQ